jgi:hypothetical protein
MDWRLSPVEAMRREPLTMPHRRRPGNERQAAMAGVEKIAAPLDRSVALPIYALWPSGRFA